LHRIGRVATAAHRICARTNVIRYASSSSKALVPKIVQLRSGSFFAAGALMTAVLFASRDEGECHGGKKQRKRRKEKLHGKRMARVKSLRTLFNFLDADKDNDIDLADLMIFLTENDDALSSKLAKSAWAETILRRGDTGTEAEGLHGEKHGDQELSFKEFSAFMMTLLQNIFEQVDVDKSGKVDGNEIKLLLAVMYGDGYMDYIRDQPHLGHHKSTSAVFEEVTSAEDEKDIKTTFGPLECADFVLHLVVQGDDVDLAALARLLRSVSTADAQWDGARQRARAIISATNSDIDAQPK